ncbi:MAG TPA: dienelactone hydrolase family protein [Spongiibacteraceae bacterium]|jgi:carboxymethylenebutenolidase
MDTIAADYAFVQTDDGTELPLYIARPSIPKAPCLIVLQEAFGLNGHIRNAAERFAREGYLVVAPELFHRTAPHGFAGDYNDMTSVMPHARATTTETLRADINSAWQWLHQDAQADTARIAAIGYCMGGYTAFLANSILPLRAAISYYGNIDPALSAGQHGPLLLIWGGLDRHIDLTKRRAVSDALRNDGKSFVDVEFSNADHGFFCDERASYNENAAHEAWALTLAFLQQQLR